MNFNEIIDSLLTGYEEGGSQNMEAYLKEKGQELGLSEENMKKVEQAAAAIDRMSKNMDSLQEAKAKGLSVKDWMADKLEEAFKPLEEGEAKQKLVEKLTESIETAMSNSIKSLE